jgi:hypothetical protein
MSVAQVVVSCGKILRLLPLGADRFPQPIGSTFSSYEHMLSQAFLKAR